MTSIGHYEVTSLLGAGGMGEVYRARDTRLNRDVAIKVLPDLLAGDPQRRARFEREAQALAALNHPNIAQIYGVEESRGSLALVMELVDGPTLADLVATSSLLSPAAVAAGASDAAARSRGLPLEEAIRIARQVADALEAAHAAGIVHRDLKPANIKVRPDGLVKVLDFGLARVIGLTASGSGGAAADSPTIMSPAVTAQGVIVGTAAYMAPEQARGQVADARSDIWALGVILYEMLTGTALFRGVTASDVLASVLRDPPRWAELPPETPPHIHRLLRRCLQKDPQLRLRNAGDARLELMDEDPAPAAAGTVARRTLTWRGAAAGVIVACLAVAGAFVAGRGSAPEAERRLRKWTVEQRLVGGGWHYGGRYPAISPNGRLVAYVDGPRLRLRDFSALESREVMARFDLGYAAWPAWSPDGAHLAFTLTSAIDRTSLWKVPVTGGEAAKICDLPPSVVLGVVWRPDGTIVLNTSQAPFTGTLLTVPEGGGMPQPMPLPEGTQVYSVHALPDGSLIYGRGKAGVIDTVIDTPGKPPASLPLQAAWTTYSPSGHLVYSLGGGKTDGSVWAVPFDLPRRELTGQPFVLAAGGAGPTVSADGTLAYQRVIRGRSELNWVDRRGMPLGMIGQPQDGIWSPALSLDGTQVAVVGIENYVASIWVHDVPRGTKSRLAFAASGEVNSPVWVPGARRVSFAWGWRIFETGIDGGEAEPLSGPSGPDGWRGVTPQYDPAWSRDGRYLVFGQYDPGTRGDVWMLEKGASAPKPVFRTPYNEGGVTLSPDARYMAYLSDETGRPELFLRTFPEGSEKVQISSGGAAFPRWSAKGDEIFYVEGRTLMSVPVRTAPSVQLGRPQRLFDLEEHAGRVRTYDTADGQRFIVVRTVEPSEPGVAIVENWVEEFRR